MKGCEPLDLKLQHFLGRIPVYNPVRHRLPHSAGALQRVAVHAGAHEVVANLGRFSENPAPVGRKRVRSIEQKIVLAIP